MNVLRLAGRHAGAVMLIGMGVVALLPGVSAGLRPFLPLLVSLVLGLAIARLDVGAVLRDFARPQRLAVLGVLVFLFLPVTCLALVTLGRLAGAGPDTLLALAVFGAAPPLSSAASLALLLGYNARITLQLGLLATVALPVIGPLSLALVGIEVEIAALAMAFRIATIIAGGFAFGLTIQRAVGKARIAANAEAFNGVAALAMILFLFPLFDGVSAYVAGHPGQALTLLVLAIALNFGGHLAMARGACRITDRETASALGLSYGNRNISFYLAVLPANPALGLFIAAAQVPIYATPALFGGRR
jgi:hypothetical protein